jgi:hypothetical protein
MANDGRVRQQEERFGYEGAECRDGEAEDFPGVPAGGYNFGGGA